MAKAWSNLREHIATQDPVPAGLYRGGNHNYKTEKDVKNVIYDMKHYLMTTVEAYQKICETATGNRAALKKVATPFVEEDQRAARAEAPCAQGPCIRCEWCGHTFPDDKKCRYECYADIKTEQQRSNEWVGSVLAADHDLDKAPEDKCMLHEAACSLLMKLWYAARMARPDLQRPTVRLSSYVTKWNRSMGQTPPQTDLLHLEYACIYARGIHCWLCCAILGMHRKYRRRLCGTC